MRNRQLPGKKAFTPLVGTAFLLIFAIGLGILVMSWGNSEMQIQTIDAGCDDIEIKVTELGGRPQICMQGNVLSATLENDGNGIVFGI